MEKTVSSDNPQTIMDSSLPFLSHPVRTTILLLSQINLVKSLTTVHIFYAGRVEDLYTSLWHP